MKSLLPLILVLAACQTAEAEVTDAAIHIVPAVEDLPAPFDPDLAAPQDGLAPATKSLIRITKDLRAAPPARKAELRAAARELLTNCPYNRSAAQLPMAMQQVLANNPDPALDPLKVVLMRHVTVLEELGMTELPMPEPGDYLHDKAHGLVDAAALHAHPDPTEATATLVDQIQALVDAYPEATTARIEAADALIGPATQGHWPLKAHLMSIKTELETLEHEAQDPMTRAQAGRFVGVMNSFSGLGC